MATTLSKFLAAQAAIVAAQLAIARAKFGKADLTDEERQAIEEVIAAVDFTGWAVLAGDIAPILDELTQDQSHAVLLRLGIDVEARSEILNIVNADALEYAQARAAEMVGMRVDELGRLVANPNAEWRIDEGTRELLRADVTEALAEGWTNDQLAAKLAESYAFSDERAMVIARTETQLAQQAGAVNSYRASGVVDGKQWLTAEDDRVSDECMANGEAGQNGDGVLTDWDAAYPSGDVAPPAHPNCRCQILPWFEPNAEAAPAAQPEGAEA